MNNTDPFTEIARYYDRIMDHVNYDRWFDIATALGDLLPAGFVHLDAACGTGTLLKRLRRAGWRSLGIDLSPGMIRSSRLSGLAPPAAVADLRALPFADNLDYITCLFDSMNFVLDEVGLEAAFRSYSAALKPGGILYFDVVTERMVTQHFKDQEWTEDNGQFSTTWRSSYCRQTGITETEVRVTSGAGGTFLERIYPMDSIEELVSQSGLSLLGAFDAHTWKSPHRKTIRIDFVAAKRPGAVLVKRFKALRAKIRARIC